MLLSSFLRAVLGVWVGIGFCVLDYFPSYDSEDGEGCDDEDEFQCGGFVEDSRYFHRGDSSSFFGSSASSAFQAAGYSFL